MLVTRPDLDDKILHFALVFGGMVVYGFLNRVADWLGLDLFKFFRKKGKR